jgi:hypothetical protein
MRAVGVASGGFNDLGRGGGEAMGRVTLILWWGRERSVGVGIFHITPVPA